MVYAWDMKGSTCKPSFTPKVKELNGLELPKGTVLEVEFVPELRGEVRMITLLGVDYYKSILLHSSISFLIG